MSNETKGFASMTAKRHFEVSRRGGKRAAMSAKKVQYTPEQARTFGQKGLETRLRNLAHEAALRLVSAYGFNTDDLNRLNLTPQEYIYYGGRTAVGRYPERLQELADRIQTTKAPIPV